VVSTGAQTPALFGFQSPGDYATFNSNHTPDGTRGLFSTYCAADENQLDNTDLQQHLAPLDIGSRRLH
jgi:hypothetical protein